MYIARLDKAGGDKSYQIAHGLPVGGGSGICRRGDSLKAMEGRRNCSVSDRD